jgi:hypothetical protein
MYDDNIYKCPICDQWVGIYHKCACIEKYLDRVKTVNKEYIDTLPDEDALMMDKLVTNLVEKNMKLYGELVVKRTELKDVKEDNDILKLRLEHATKKLNTGLVGFVSRLW